MDTGLNDGLIKEHIDGRTFLCRGFIVPVVLIYSHHQASSCGPPNRLDPGNHRTGFGHHLTPR